MRQTTTCGVSKWKGYQFNLFTLLKTYFGLLCQRLEKNRSGVILTRLSENEKKNLISHNSISCVVLYQNQALNKLLFWFNDVKVHGKSR